MHGFTVIGTGSAAKRDVVESTGATLVPYDTGDVPAGIRRIAPEGVDLILDLVGGDALRQVADLVGDPTRTISAADPATTTDLGGAALERTRGTGQDHRGDRVRPGRPPRERRYRWSAPGRPSPQLEGGHTTGKVAIEMSLPRTGPDRS